MLRLLHRNPEFTQRELEERVSIGLGSVNNCFGR